MKESAKNTKDKVPLSKKKPASLARKAGIFTISRAITIVSQLAATMVLTRSLPKEDFALLSFLLVIYATVQTFGQLGLPDSVYYFFEKLPANTRKSMVRLVSKALFLLSLAGMVVMFGIGWFGSMKEGFGDVRSLVWVFMVLLVFELPSLSLPNVLIALDKAYSAAWFNIYIGISQFIAMTLPLFTADPVYWIAWGLLAYGVLRLLISALLFYHNFKNQPDDPLPDGTLRELFNYSVPLSLAQLFWSLNRQVDKYVVQWLLPVAAFAEYTVGAWELPIIPTIAYSVASVMMPQLVGHYLKGEKEPLLDLWFKSIRKVSVIVLPLVVVFLVTAEEFITLLFSADYKNAAIPFQIYTLILLQRVASYSNMQKALGSTKEITRAAVYLFGINAVLCIPLALWLGMAGPPLASLVANLFTWWYALNVIRKLIGIKFSQVFPFRFYARVLFVAALASIPAILLKTQWELSVSLAFPVLAATYLTTYLLLAKVSGIITTEDWNRLLRAIRVKKQNI